MERIIRITQRVYWENALKTGYYRAHDYEQEGFIHTSTYNQMIDTANKHYHGKQDLILLVIDQSKVIAPIKFELASKRGQDFPHIYGDLNLEAVVAVVDFPVNKDGTFSTPSELFEHLGI